MRTAAQWSMMLVAAALLWPLQPHLSHFMTIMICFSEPGWLSWGSCVLLVLVRAFTASKPHSAATTDLSDDRSPGIRPPSVEGA